MKAPLIAAGLLAFAAAAPADPPRPNAADEPRARGASLARGAAFLDAAAADWTARRRCATCHTNVPYLFARPALGVKASAEEKAVRAFFEGRAANWGRGRKGDRPRNDTEVVVTAAALAMHDAATTGKLHPATRKALARLWEAQQKGGAWDWEKCGWPPLEHDDYYGAVLAALAVGSAPEGYGQSGEAAPGLARLRGYLRRTPPPSLHHRAWLLWASARLDGLLGPAARKEAVAALRAAQRPDGGWSLPSLGDWRGFDGRDNDTRAPSDGYATGLAAYALLRAGLKKDDPALVKAAAWLRANQRDSGRYFTRSLNTDRAHYISHAGTALALMALAALE